MIILLNLNSRLIFLCDEYSKHNEMYDNSEIGYYSDVRWLAPYFYSLKSTRKNGETSGKINWSNHKKNNKIIETEAEELDDEFTETEKWRYSRISKEKNEIITAFEK